MKKRTTIAIVSLLALGVLWASAWADAGRPGGGRGPQWLMPLWGELQPAQRKQVHALVAADRTGLHLLHAQEKAARKALTAKLLSNDKNPDVTQEVAKLKQAEAAMLDARVALALKVRALMSPEQISQAADFWTKLQSLHEQEHALFAQHRAAVSPGSEDRPQ
jgi:heavy-metal resistance protein